MGIGGLLTTAFIVGLSGAMAPGSLLVVVVTQTVQKGFWAGPVAVLGHAVMEVIMVGLLAFGLGQLLSYSAALGAIGLVGGLMLFWFGWGTLKTARSASLDFDKQAAADTSNGRRKGLWNTALSGMVASISNPYWILWWATVGAAYVASGMASSGKLGAATFLTGHLAADMAWYALVSLAISTGARFFNDRVYRGILYFCGTLLFLFGAYFLKIGLEFVAGR
jgi:threonine/homoserine/homoserine lactone efflux protein